MFSSKDIKLLAVGDTHGEIDLLAFVMHKAFNLGVDAIVQLGDFGYYPHIMSFSSFLEKASQLAVASKIPIYFIDGNHDDHASLDHTQDYTSFKAVADNIYWCPRGHRWTWGGVRFASLGGAYSTDRLHRLFGRDAHPTLECIKHRDYYHLMEHTCDVLLTHDAPDFVDLDICYPYEEGQQNRKIISHVLSQMEPSLLLHGHYHKQYETGAGTTRICGLGCTPSDCMGVISITGSHSHFEFVS